MGTLPADDLLVDVLNDIDQLNPAFDSLFCDHFIRRSKLNCSFI